MRLVFVAHVFGAPAAVEQTELAPVIPDPSGAIDHVGSKKAAPEIGGAAQDAIEPAEGPERFAVAIPLAVIFLVRATEETI